MTVFLVLTAMALVFAIAAIAVGREARRLDAVPPAPVFDPDEAVEYVASHVPFEVSAQLSFDDVRRLLDWHLDYIRGKGLSANGSTPVIGTPVVIGGAEAVQYVLDQAAAAGTEISAANVHAVLEAQMAYLEAIGAVGPEAATDDVGES
ncbi:MAG: hypothetical protein ACR2H3_08600 [Acidimicrobiales bacterium]